MSSNLKLVYNATPLISQPRPKRDSEFDFDTLFTPDDDFKNRVAGIIAPSSEEHSKSTRGADFSQIIIQPELLNNLPQPELSNQESQVYSVDTVFLEYIDKWKSRLHQIQIHTTQDIFSKLKAYAKILLEIHSQYEFGYQGEKKRALLIEIKQLLGEVMNEESSKRYLDFLSHKAFPELNQAEIDEILKLAREVFQLYFFARKDYDKEVKNKKEQEEIQKKRQQQEEIEKRSTLIASINGIESTFFGNGYDFLTSDQEKGLSIEEKTKVAEHKMRIAQARVNRLQKSDKN